MKNTILILLFMLLPAFASAESIYADRPHWSLEVKGGQFVPAIDGWATYYGERSTGQFEASLAYKVLRQVEVGVAAGRIRDGGQGWAPIIHKEYAGHINYQLFPVNAFVVLRGIFTEDHGSSPMSAAAGPGCTIKKK